MAVNSLVLDREIQLTHCATIGGANIRNTASYRIMFIAKNIRI